MTKRTINDFLACKPTQNNSQSNRCEKQQKNPDTVETLSKKIEETRQRIKDEEIEWKKKLLGRLEYVLTKRLRKMERLTGIKSTLAFPTNKQEKVKNSALNKNKKDCKQETKNETAAIQTDGKKDVKIKKKKVKKSSLSLDKDDLPSDDELTIEETQGTQSTYDKDSGLCKVIAENGVIIVS